MLVSGHPGLEIDIVVELHTGSAAHLAAQLNLTLCDPMDCGPPGSSGHGDSPGKNTGVGYSIQY